MPQSAKGLLRSVAHGMGLHRRHLEMISRTKVVGAEVVRHHRSPTRMLAADYWHARRRRKAIDEVCPGYSGDGHWEFFGSMLRRKEIASVLVLGVYYGRDIAYLCELLGAEGRSDVSIVGVDRFEDSACADWPEHLRGASWKEAGYGDAPALERTRANLERLGFGDRVELQRSNAEDYLRATSRSFDFIYIDTSHDYQTTRDTIELSLARATPHGFLAGDDFSDKGTWGVATAVRDCFTRFELFGSWIWLARAGDRRSPLPAPAAAAAPTSHS